MGEFQVDFNDVINVRYILLISIGVAVVASFIYLILLYELLMWVYRTSKLCNFAYLNIIT